MSTLIIDGGKPLIGSVKISGSKNSVLKIISASMFCNDDVVVSNVPRVGDVFKYLEIIKEMGAKVDWIGNNKIVLNGAGLSTYIIPYELGSVYRIVNLLVGPLVFRFGKAIVPLSKSNRPVNRLIDTWKTLGMNIENDGKNLVIKAINLQQSNIKFKINTLMGTDNAILSSLFISGETLIYNANEEPEVDDLVSFCNIIGGRVERVEPRLIKIIGTNIFKGGNFEVISDCNEAATFMTAAVVTNGNIFVTGVDRTSMTSFVNVLTKMGCKYEFSKDEVRVWRDNDQLNNISVCTSPAPGFVSDWQSLTTLIATQAEGESLIYDTVYHDRFEYTVDLNRMGAKIDLVTPSDANFPLIVSDDLYDYSKLGEPHSVAKITGPTKLRGVKIGLTHFIDSSTLIIAALCASGKSDVTGYGKVEKELEDFINKLVNLGAQVSLSS